MSVLSKSFANDNSRSRKVRKNILGSIVVKGISIVVSFLLVPLTLGYVSSELYGVWLTLSSISVWLGFFDIGFTLGLKNKLTEALAIGDIERGKTLVSTTYVMLIIIFAPICIIAQFVIPLIEWCGLLNVSDLYYEDIVLSMRIIVLCFSLQMILNIINTIYQSLQKVAISSLFPVIGHTISLILVYWATIYFKPSLVVLSFCISAAPVFVLLLASIILFRSKLKYIAPSLSSVDFSFFNDIIRLGLSFFIIQIQVVVFFQTTNFLISNMSTPENVSIYNIAYKYLGLASMIFVIILNPLWPAFTDAKAKNDYVWMKRTYQRFQKFYLIFVCVVIIMMFLSPIAYHVWIGDRLIIPFEWTFVIAIYTIINCWDSLQVYIINGLGVLRLQTYIVMIGIIFHIPLSFILNHYVGEIGVVLSMIIITTIYSLLFTLQVNKLLTRTAKGVWAK